MADTHDTHAHGDPAHSEKHYIKIWGILMVLLLISIFGPFIGIKLVTLITAFGIAFVKAYLVAKNFMHLNVEKPIVWYFLGACLAFMVLFFAAVSPDVMNHEGRRWVNTAAQAEVERGMKLGEAGVGHHEGGAGAEHGAAGEHAAPEHGAPEHAPAEGAPAPAGEQH